METLKPIIAKNISELRCQHGMTQIELAEYLNYSDKAVSKWERGESVPDVAVLKKIAERYGVSLDYLVQEAHDEPPTPLNAAPDVAIRQRNRKVITSMSILLVWLLATLCFVTLDITFDDIHSHWLSFLFALPVTMIVWLVFNSIWFYPRNNYWIISLLMWSLLASIHLCVLTLGANLWMLYLLGVPGQIIILLWSRLGKKSANPLE